MALVEFKERLISANARKKLGNPAYYGEKIYAKSYYGVEYKEASPFQYGIKIFGQREYGENLSFEGIYQTRHYKGGKFTVKEKFYIPTETLARTSDPNRVTFANAVSAWQALTASQKEVYRVKSNGKRMSGYNVFLHEYLISH